MKHVLVTTGILVSMLFAYNLANGSPKPSKPDNQYWLVAGQQSTKLEALKAALNEKPVWKCQQQELSDRGTLKNAKIR